MQVHCIALLALVPTTLGSIFPVSTSLSNVVEVATLAGNEGNGLNATTKVDVETRRKGKFRKKSQRSTSSSSGERAFSGDVKDSGTSLQLSTESDSSTEDKEISDGRGWRKWHRKCTPCPVEMAKKWRDPSIRWICGGYQRARRTFKSECMMYYRNCQDGTMFVKVHDYRCDDTVPGYNGGKHFFYDYKVNMPDDTSGKSSDDDKSYSEGSDSNE